MQSEQQWKSSTERQDMPTPKFVQESLPDQGEVAPTILNDLAKPQASIAARFLYDELGSRLFDAITALPEYYPTRTERAVFDEHLPAITATSGIEGCTLIDLGAGNCEKAQRLFPVVKPKQYVPVDISVEFLRTATTRLQLEYPDVEIFGVGADFSSRLELPDGVREERRLFFYPGSSIGNFTPAEAEGFLRGVRGAMRADSELWIGVDLVKDIATMESAYDDQLGVTAAFNRNGLRHVNALAQTDFSPKDWRHIARFNEDESRIETFLAARERTEVTWPGGGRSFAAGERIHMENSYKYEPERFRALLTAAGLDPVGMWTDAKNWFGLFVARPSAS